MIEIIIKDREIDPLLYMIQAKIKEFLKKSNIEAEVKIQISEE